MMFLRKFNCLWAIVQVIENQEGLILMVTPIDSQGRIRREHPFYAATPKGLILFADLDHFAERMEQRVPIRHLACHIEMTVVQCTFHKIGERRAGCEASI